MMEQFKPASGDGTGEYAPATAPRLERVGDYRISGSLDNSFGTGGKRVIDLGSVWERFKDILTAIPGFLD
jgi:hypothetical protein